MKKGGMILVLISALSLCFVLGVFTGRNLKDEYVMLSENSLPDSVLATENALDVRLDINSATKVQLMELPGIGEVTADRIIQYRTDNGPFQTTDDLMNVEGIGEKKLQQIEARIKVGG